MADVTTAGSSTVQRWPASGMETSKPHLILKCPGREPVGIYLLGVMFLLFVFFNEGGYEGGQVVHNTDIGNVKNGCIRISVDGYNKSRAPHA